MNDSLIRENFHRQRLRCYHASSDALVVDELGLKHGKCRADIAVINGHLVGYEIKSDEDSLDRLEEQVEVYSAVFDRATVIVGTKHLDSVRSLVPHWWGIIVGRQGSRGGIAFDTIREARQNKSVDPFSVAQLLWSCEAATLLKSLGEPPKTLRQKRSALYERLADLLSLTELRHGITACLKRRRNWRCR